MNHRAVSEMTLEEMYSEQLKLSYWRDSLQGRQLEQVQARIDELDREIEKRHNELPGSIHIEQ